MTPFEICSDIEKLLSPLTPSKEILSEISEYVIKVQRKQELDTIKNMATIAKSMSHTTSMNVAAAMDFMHTKRTEELANPEKSGQKYVFRYFDLM